MPTVPQTSVIFFSLLVGFIVFITIRGELSSYLYVIGLGGAPVAGTTAPTTTKDGSGLPPYTQNPDGSICVGSQCSVMKPVKV